MVYCVFLILHHLTKFTVGQNNQMFYTKQDDIHDTALFAF